jgi:hypothetical protein
MPKISLNLDELKAEKQSLGDFLAQPDAYSDPEFTTKNKRFAAKMKAARERREALAAKAKKVNAKRASKTKE